MRLVTRKLADGATVYSRTSTGATSTICSKLSSTSSTWRSSEGVRDALLERCFAVVADAEGERDRGEQQRGFEHILQADEVGAVGEQVA